MPLTEQTVIDKIEVLETGVIQVRRAHRVYDGSELIAQRYHRFVLEPGANVTDADARLQTICHAVWTPSVVHDFQVMRKHNEETLPGVPASTHPAQG